VAAPLPWRTAWVVGASSGIGAEIARQLAERGVAVAASARSSEKLASLGKGIRAFHLDVTDRTATETTFRSIEASLGSIDIAVFCAGTYEPMTIDHFDADIFERIMRVNYFGTVNCLAAVLPAMRARRHGHISWVASVAGYRGLPKAAAYGPAKAALINLAESLRPECEAAGIRVSVINPGFVATPMTAANDFPMPFLMSPEDAARRTIEGLARGKFEIAYPRRFVLLLKGACLLPYRLYFWLIRKFVLRA
jgi:short-subunit dehydrogenase